MSTHPEFSKTSLTSRLATKLVQFRLSLFVATLVATILVTAGVLNLGFDTDFKVFVEEDNEYRQALEKLNANYSNNEETIIFIVHSTNPGEGVFTADAIDATRKLADLAETLPYVTEVEAFTNHQRVQVSADGLLVMDLVSQDDELTLDLIEDIRTYTDEAYGIKGFLASLKDDAIVVVAYFALGDGNRTSIVQEIADNARAISSEVIATHPSIDVHLSGVLMFDQAMVDSIVADSKTITPLTLLLVFGLLFWLFKTVIAPIFILNIVGLTVLTSFGLAGWWGYNINTLTFSAIFIIATLSVADLIHILTGYLKARHRGSDPQTAMITSININLTALFLTTATTSVGFLALNFSVSPPVQELGSFTAVGVVVAFLFSLTVFPFLVLTFERFFQGNELPPLFRTQRITDIVITYRRQILLFGTIVTLILCTPVFLNKLNDDAHKWFAERTEFRQATSFSEGRISGLRTISYTFDSKRENGIYDVAFVNDIDALTNWLLEQPEVVEVRSYLDIVREVNRQEFDTSTLPDDSPTIAQLLLLYELSVPSWRGITKYITFDRREAKVLISSLNLSNVEMIKLEQRITAWIAENSSYETSLGASVTLMLIHIAQENLFGMLLGTSLAMVVVALILIFGLQSLHLGVLSLIPNVAPILMIYGVWGIISGELNLAAVTMFAISLGIVVDDTIHILVKYQTSKRLGQSDKEAVRFTIENSASALLITTLCLCTGFFVLGLSNFAMSATQGVLVGCTILVALIFDLFYLPSLIMRSSK